MTDNPMQAPGTIQRPPGTGASVPAQAEVPQPQPSLRDYAAGISQLSVDVQRQTAAHGYFQQMIADLTRIAQHPDQPISGLPFIAVRYPTDGEHPGELQLDLNTLSPQTLAKFHPLFAQLEHESGRLLLSAWENLHEIARATAPVVAAARANIG